jgi:hypothetical protein
MHERPAIPASARDWPKSHTALAALLVLLSLGITAPAFARIYRTVVDLLNPFMGWWSWTVPVCGEIAFAFLFLNGVLLQLRRAPGGGVRSGFMAPLVTGSVALQVYASRGSVPSVIGNVVVVAFFGVMLSGKATIMSLRGKIRSDSVTLSEWAAHPVTSFRLWRWMKAWGEPSRDKAQDRYMRLLAIAIAQEDPHHGVGKGRGWRRRLPVTLRYELATGMVPDRPGDDWPDAIATHVRKQLASVRTGAPAAVSAVAQTPVSGTVPETTPSDRLRHRPRQGSRRVPEIGSVHL